MKTQLNLPAKRGFTLIELLVAMAITTIIVTVLVSITSVALDTFNRSRSELRASRQAKSMIDSMARDLESLVVRSGNTSQWLSAIGGIPNAIGGKLQSTSASKLIFFTAATDRYDGAIGGVADKGGDVSCVAYDFRYDDPIRAGGEFKTFVLNRLLVNPDEAFNHLLGTTDVEVADKNLAAVFDTYEGTQTSDKSLNSPKNFICENIFQFSITFNVQVADSKTPGAMVNIPITVGPTATDTGPNVQRFEMFGNKLRVSDSANNYAPDVLETGRVTAVTVSATAISDAGIEQLRVRPSLQSDSGQRSEFLTKNTYQYSKTIQIPTP